MSYCTTSDVTSLFGDISDEPTTSMINTAILNADAWININLTRRYVPIPVTVPSALKTAAIYYAASDVKDSLYQGDEYLVQYDVWFQKAQDFLNGYIDSYLNSEATAEEQANVQMVKHSHSPTYHQRRRRRL